MRLFALGLFLAVVAACSSTPTCSATTCTGCCDTTGMCLNGTANTACGKGGATCSACAAGATCSMQVCTAGGTGGGAGGGSATGGGSAAGGGSATGGGTAMGGGTGTGGQGGIGGGGFNFNTPDVHIDFPSTCTFAPCGGAIAAGHYFYTKACIGMDEFQPFISQIEGVCGMGSTMITGVDGGITGYTVVEGTAALRAVSGSVTVSASITGTCASSTVCGLLASGVSQQGYTGSCMVNGMNCDCTATRTIDIHDNGQFRTSGNDLTLADPQKTFSYCVTGNDIATKEIDAGTSSHEFGVATMTKQ